MHYTFENYSLGPGRRELARCVDRVVVGLRVFDLLLYLMKSCARVVSKIDPLDAAWAARTVSESTLTNHMMRPQGHR
jgi:DNA-binding winged helix-turn-helix (wHTH) protein